MMSDTSAMPEGQEASSATNIELARAEDVEPIRRLLLDSFSTYRRYLPAPVADSYLAEVASFNPQSDSAVVLVARGATALAGTVTWLPDASTDGHPWPDGGSVLRMLAVATQWRSQGVGRALVDACVDQARARERGFIGLHTAPFMTSAQALYEAAGFVRTPEWDFDAGQYYGNADTASISVPGLAYMIELSERTALPTSP